MKRKSEQAVIKGRRVFLSGSMAMASLPLFSSLGFSERGRHTMSAEDLLSASTMTRAAEALRNSLSAEQRAKASFSLEDEQRFDWHFIPRARKGIPFKEFDPAQRLLASALVSSGLSPQGFAKASTVMSLEAVLREIEQGKGPVRDSELYYVSLFGDLGSNKPWGWRVEGHHLSLNFTVADGKNVASTPAFFGANPAEVLHGPRKGLRTLAAEEDLARALAKSLDDKQRAQAVVSVSAPSDILSTNSRKAQPLKPAGLQTSKLGGKQQEILMSLLREYATRHAGDVATARLDRVRSDGLGNIFFAWAGGLEKGQAHYYRIQGSSFLVEYDNIQNNANHIHSVWRDFNGDFGVDLLGSHYQKDHR